MSEEYPFRKILSAGNHVVPIVEIEMQGDSKVLSCNFLGTGFCYTEGRIATCAHVLRSTQHRVCAAKVSFGKAQDHVFLGLNNIRFHESIDLCWATLGPKNAKEFQPLQIDFQSRRVIGTGLINYSYVSEPHERHQVAITPRLQKGYVTRRAFDSRMRNHEFLEISFPALRGMSGSPIMRDDTGHVVGMVYENFRSQVLEDLDETLTTTSSGETTTEMRKVYKVIEFGKALDLSAFRDFLMTD